MPKPQTNQNPNPPAKARGSNPETAVQRAVLETCRALGIVAVRVNSAPTPRFDKRTGQVRWMRNSTTTPGMSDILGVCPGGRAIAIEVKRADGTGRVSMDQEMFLTTFAMAGGLAMVLDSTAKLIDLAREASAHPQGWSGLVSPWPAVPRTYTTRDARTSRRLARG